MKIYECIKTIDYCGVTEGKRYHATSVPSTHFVAILRNDRRNRSTVPLAALHHTGKLRITTTERGRFEARQLIEHTPFLGTGDNEQQAIDNLMEAAGIFTP